MVTTVEQLTAKYQTAYDQGKNPLTLLRSDS